MDCAYCILQTYFHPPILQYFVNHDQLLADLDQALSQPERRRIGTGEFTDSLIWEPWSDLTPNLVERFARQDNSILELKTKTTAIERLKGLDHQRKTIVSWSLNTPRIIANQERSTASLHARLKAASICLAEGYPLAFHFDPIFIYPGWESEYAEVINTLFETIPADQIVWISMGTFRFMPALHPVVRRRFPNSDIIYGEFIPGLDGKMRYFKPLRIKVYRKLAEWITARAPEVTLYFCMEDDQVWEACLGFVPESRGGLPSMLDRSARLHCGLK
jgi:spore photoproduct lyase